MLGVPDIRARKGAGAPLVVITAYDLTSASIAAAAGVDLILVGDSLAMVMLGHRDTLSIGMDEMVMHTASVARAGTETLIVADLPWLSYHLGPEAAVENAGRLVRAGAAAVKLEGGAKRRRVIEALIDAEIPVMGHLGLTPQSSNVLGGFKVQGRDDKAARALVADALLLADLGAFAIVLEGMPAVLAAEVTSAVPVPTIGIGAGPHCDGQVLVFHDLLGLQDQLRPRFVRRYAELRQLAVDAVRRYAEDVRDGSFPSAAESYGAGRVEPPPSPADADADADAGAGAGSYGPAGEG